MTWGPLLQESGFIEENGKVKEATVVNVIRVASAGLSIGGILTNALDDVTIPQPADSLGGGHDDVKVERRIPTIISHDENYSNVRVVCEYRLQRPIAVNAKIRGGAVLNQVTTQVDKNKTPVLLSYAGSKPIKADVQVFESQAFIVKEDTINTDDPDAWVRQFINKVNSDTFRGDAAGTWLMTNIEYEMLDESSDPYKYRFRYEATRRKDGWLYTVAWRNSQGEIPGDVDDYPGVSIQDVEWHDKIAFSLFFS